MIINYCHQGDEKMRLYIIRHADPDYENDTITPDGHLEARALAERMRRTGLDKIFCSPLGRAMATMKYTADALGMDYEILDWTRELHELWFENTPWGPSMAWDIPGEFIRSRDTMPNHETWMKEEFFNQPIISEAFEKVKKGSDDFLKSLGYERIGGRYRILKRNTYKIAVFCHNGLALTWLAHLLEIPLTLMWSGFWLAPTSVTTVLFDERSDEWAVPRCLHVGDISHLYHAGLQEKPSGIIRNFY